jgi:4-amino-4-deoxy-L-arabinose transferase-like glycosyltransferase
MRRGPWIIPVAIFVIALGYRLLYVVPINVKLTSDMKGYADCARNFLSGEGLVMTDFYQAYRPPLYPLFLAASFAVFGERYLPVRVIQSVASAASAVLVFFIVLHLFDPGRRRRPETIKEALNDEVWLMATLAGFSVAIFDSLVFYAGEFLTETWYTLLLLALVYHLVRSPEKGIPEKGKDWRPAVLSGAWLGMMALLRPVALFLLPVVLIVERRRGATVKGLLYGIFAAAAVIIPWTLRNAVVTGGFVPISTNTGVNLYLGHNPYFGYWSFGNKEGIRQATDFDEVEESRYFTKLAIEYATGHPWQTVKNTFAKFYNLYRLPWTPSFLARSEEDRKLSCKPWPWPGNGARLRFALVGWLPMIEWDIPFILVFLFGLALSFRDWRRFLPLYLIVLFHTLAYMVFFGKTRFAVPLMPVFCIFTSYGIVRILVWAGWVGGRQGRG